MALEAWDEACSLLARLGPDAPSSETSSERVEVSALDAVARRSRQVERIIEASIVSDFSLSTARYADVVVHFFSL